MNQDLRPIILAEATGSNRFVGVKFFEIDVSDSRIFAMKFIGDFQNNRHQFWRRLASENSALCPVSYHQVIDLLLDRQFARLKGVSLRLFDAKRKVGMLSLHFDVFQKAIAI